MLVGGLPCAASFTGGDKLLNVPGHAWPKEALLGSLYAAVDPGMR